MVRFQGEWGERGKKWKSFVERRKETGKRGNDFRWEDESFRKNEN